MFADASSGKTTLFLYRRKAFLANFSPSAINFGAWRRGSSTPSSELRSELDANEIYEDLATGRPLPFLRVGQRQSVLRRHPASARCAQAPAAVVMVVFNSATFHSFASAPQPLRCRYNKAHQKYSFHPRNILAAKNC